MGTVEILEDNAITLVLLPLVDGNNVLNVHFTLSL
jgi:hypothetical protein